MSKVKERPILFSAEMVRAILDGRKTQTRRVMKPQPTAFWNDGRQPVNLPYDRDNDRIIRCPYGSVGDRLWVRETVKRAGSGTCWYAADNSLVYGTDKLTRMRMAAHYQYKRDTLPSIHLPRDWSRITLEITGVRVERLNDITPEDVAAEGVFFDEPELTVQFGLDAEARYCFSKLWETINGPYSWAANEWCWVVEFKRL